MKAQENPLHYLSRLETGLRRAAGNDDDVVVLLANEIRKIGRVLKPGNAIPVELNGLFDFHLPRCTALGIQHARLQRIPDRSPAQEQTLQDIDAVLRRVPLALSEQRRAAMQGAYDEARFLAVSIERLLLEPAGQGRAAPIPSSMP